VLPKPLDSSRDSVAVADLTFDHGASWQANLCEPTQHLAITIDHHFGSANR
jgi:hypothetical protein